MSDIVDDAEELISKCFGEYIEVIPQREIMNGFTMLPGLVAEIKRLQKIAIEERASVLILTQDCTKNEDAAQFHHRCECEYVVEKCPIADWWRARAAKVLGIQAIQTRKMQKQIAEMKSGKEEEMLI